MLNEICRYMSFYVVHGNDRDGKRKSEPFREIDAHQKASDKTGRNNFV